MKIENTEEEVKALEGKELVITSLNKENSRERLEKEIKEGLESKEKTEIRRNYSPEMVRKILTPKRRELLNYLSREKPGSITQVSQDLDRTNNEVSKDLDFLNSVGIVYFERNKNMKKPVIPFRSIKLDVELIENNSEGVRA